MTLFHKIVRDRFKRRHARMVHAIDNPKFIPLRSGLLIDADTEMVVGDWPGSANNPNDGMKYDPVEREGLSPHKLKKLARKARELRQLEKELTDG